MEIKTHTYFTSFWNGNKEGYVRGGFFHFRENAKAASNMAVARLCKYGYTMVKTAVFEMKKDSVNNATAARYKGLITFYFDLSEVKEITLETYMFKETLEEDIKKVTDDIVKRKGTIVSSSVYQVICKQKHLTVEELRANRKERKIECQQLYQKA